MALPRRSLLAAALAAPWVAAPANDTVAQQAGLRPAGAGLMRVWGLSVYRARLWVAPDFEPLRWPAAALLLELEYLRHFSGSAIAERSLQEMRRQARLDEAQAARWQRALAALLPDVAPGDRLLGWHRPQQGALFLRGSGERLGEIADAAFARLFFGIWLSDQSSAPELRQALLGPWAGPRL